MLCVRLRCDAGYKGPQCDEPQDFNILYVVPSGQKLHYVLIAAIIGAVQIAIIVAVVMCITRYSSEKKKIAFKVLVVKYLCLYVSLKYLQSVNRF